MFGQHTRTMFSFILRSLGILLACGSVAFGVFQSNTRKYSFSALSDVGEIQCGVMCVQNGRCAAINYSRDQLVCELVESPASPLTDNHGWKHTSDFDYVPNNLCGSVTILRSDLCVPLSSQTAILVKHACVSALSTPANSIASTGQIDVGISAKFTCLAGYAGNGQDTSTCLASGQWSSHNYQCDEDEWPSGTYSLLQPTNGCPSQFTTGYRSWRPERTGQSTFSQNPNLQGYANKTHIEWHFCTKATGSGSSAWPVGDYCVMRKGGTCPNGFTMGMITFDEEDSAPSGRSQGTGVLPDGNYGSNTDLYFCCKSDGSVAVETTFPVSTPFILFRYSSSSCQLVSGMTVEPGYTFFDSERYGNIDNSEGEVPYTSTPPTWYIYHCYYH